MRGSWLIRPLVLGVVACLLFSSGCAMLARATSQRIPVTSSPAGATVRVNGKTQGAAPLELRLPRRLKGQIIRIESPGYNPVEIRLKRGFSSRYATQDLAFGMLLGFLAFSYWNLSSDSQPAEARLLITVPAAWGGLLLIDSAAGAGFDLEPAELSVTLTKTDGPPRVETLWVDAEDLRRIKWIRVR